MPQPVVEVFAVARLKNHIAGGGVQLAHLYAGAHQPLGGLVGAAHQLVDLALLCGGLGGEKGAGHVAAIVVVDAAHIQKHHLAGLQRPVGVLVVGVGGIIGKGDDGLKAGAAASVGLVDGQDLFGQLPLGDAGADGGGKLGHAGVVDGAGLDHGFLLGRVLDGADHVAADAAHPVLPRHRQLLQAQQKAGGPVLVHAQRLFHVQIGRQQGGGVVGVVKIDHRQAHVRRAEQPVDKQPHAAVGRKQQAVHPLAGVQPQAGQVKDGGGVADQQLGQAVGRHFVPHPLQAGLGGVVLLFGHSVCLPILCKSASLPPVFTAGTG